MESKWKLIAAEPCNKMPVEKLHYSSIFSATPQTSLAKFGCGSYAEWAIVGSNNIVRKLEVRRWLKTLTYVALRSGLLITYNLPLLKGEFFLSVYCNCLEKNPPEIPHLLSKSIRKTTQNSKLCFPLFKVSCLKIFRYSCFIVILKTKSHAWYHNKKIQQVS